jgi:hypothetical protein
MDFLFASDEEDFSPATHYVACHDQRAEDQDLKLEDVDTMHATEKECFPMMQENDAEENVVHTVPPLPQTLVPTFYLSETDMASDFERTIMRIHRQCGNEFGVVKVRPPKSWHEKLRKSLFESVMPVSAKYDPSTFDYQEFMDELVSNIPVGRPATEYALPQQAHPWSYVMHVRYEYPPMSCADLYETADVPISKTMTTVSAEELAQTEEEYWAHVAERSSQPAMTDAAMVALYGCDVKRSLFPPQFRDPWNLNSLESLFTRGGGRHVAIPGVDRPYLYFGTRFSTFALHTEDLELFSVNYHWFGAPKIWYTAAPRDFHRVRDTCAKMFPSLRKEDDEFMRFKQCIVHPGLLMQAGCSMSKAVQEPGDWIVTFPNGFHGGFNAGWNCAEAINMCTEDWLPYARRAKWSQVDENAVWIAPEVIDKMDRLVEIQRNKERMRRKQEAMKLGYWGNLSASFEYCVPSIQPAIPIVQTVDVMAGDAVGSGLATPADSKVPVVDEGSGLRRSLRARIVKRTFAEMLEDDIDDSMF